MLANRMQAGGGINATLIERTLASVSTSVLTDIIYGNGKWISTTNASDRKSWTSNDSETWAYNVTAKSINSVTEELFFDEDNNVFVSVGSIGTSTVQIDTSADGVSFTSRLNHSPPGTANAATGLWVSWLSKGVIVSTTTGLTTVNYYFSNGTNTSWTDQGTTAWTGGNATSMAHDGTGVICAVGVGGLIKTSTDGASWTARTADGSYAGTFDSVIWDGSQFIAVGDSGEIQTSPTGTTWTSATSPTANRISGIALINGTYAICTTSGEVFISADLVLWYPVVNISPTGMTQRNDITVGTGNVFATCGSTSKQMYSGRMSL